MSFSVSNVGVQFFTTLNLQNEQTTLAQLNQQLATGQKYSDLTNYTPVDAHNITNFQNAITQRQAYLSGMTTVNARLNLYDTTMNDIEKIAGLAEGIASGNQTYDATKTAQINAQAKSYLQQIQDDLNQQVSGRYIYAGGRYTTQPVGNLTSLGAPSLPFTPVTTPTLPDYSAENIPTNSFTINTAPPTGNFQIGNTYIKWSDLAAGSVTNVYVNGVATPVTVTGLSAASTPTQLAANLQSTINQINSQVSDFSGMTATNTSGKVNLTYAGSLTPVIPDSAGVSSETTWTDGTVGTSLENMATTDSLAFQQDSVTVDTGFNLQYGVTSNDPGFQQVIAGLRLINAASAQTDPTVYQNYMTQAATLLTNGLNNVQATHAGVAGSTNTITQETDLQNTDIETLQNQLSNIQQVDLTSVSTQINLLQTQLQASYASTASIIQESILKYL